MRVFYNFSDALKAGPEQIFGIVSKGFIFPCSWRITGHQKTVVFFPGATRPDTSRPSFQRSTYFSELPYNCISFFDPTLFFSPTLNLGWFQGHRNVFFAQHMKKIIQDLVRAVSCENNDLVIFGTSGAGIPGFNVASAVPGCSLYVGNIQSDVSKYYKGHYKELLDACYPGETAEYVEEHRKKKISLFHVDGDFKLFYAQNLADEFHYHRHFLPMVAALRSKKIKSSVYVYEDEKSGHGPLGRARELSIIQAVAEQNDVLSQLPCGKLFNFIEPLR